MIDFQKIIDDYLSSENEPRKREKGVYWISEVVFPCVRSTYLKIRENIKSPPEVLRLYWLGNALHSLLEDAFKKSSFKVFNEEKIIVKFPEFSIHGRYDLKVQLNDEEYIVEVKSCSELPEKPFEHHVEQLNFYLNCENLRYGYLLYVEKKKLECKAFRIHVSIVLFEKTLNRIAELHKALTDGKIPSKNSFEWNGRICEYCTAREVCEKVD